VSTIVANGSERLNIIYLDLLDVLLGMGMYESIGTGQNYHSITSKVLLIQ